MAGARVIGAGEAAERALIAALLLDARFVPEVASEVSQADFDDHRLGAIFAGIVDMRREGIAIDAITVGDRLFKWGVRGIDPADLHRWTAEVPGAYAAVEYARAVRLAGLRRGLTIVATRLANDAGQLEPGLAIARAVSGLDALTKDAAGDLGSRSLGDVLADDVPDYDWLIEGLIERRDRLMLTGGEGGGKSTMLRQIAVLSAAGINPFTFFPMEPLTVLVVDAENSERQWRRAARQLAADAARQGRADPARNVELACTRRLDLTNAADLAGLHRLIDRRKPSLLVIGPLYRLTRGSINNDDDATPVLAALDSLRDRGLALIIEAHAGHALESAGVRDLRPRGSSALLGWPEFGFGLRPDPENVNGATLIRWRGDRDVRRWPVRLARGKPWPWMPTGRGL